MTDIPTRRQVLAFIALADLPTPEDVRFIGNVEHIVRIEPSTVDDMNQWTDLFGLTQRRAQRYPLNESMPQVSTLHVAHGRWRGWFVEMHAVTPVGMVEPIDDATRTCLAEVAG
jgi:hypothetical protein